MDGRRGRAGGCCVFGDKVLLGCIEVEDNVAAFVGGNLFRSASLRSKVLSVPFVDRWRSHGLAGDVIAVKACS